MAGLCEHCVTGNKISGTPKGTWIPGEGGLMNAYYASASSNTTSSDPKSVKTNKAIVIIMDVFGFDIPNPKLLADMFAERTGQDVWVPDIFRGQVVVREADLAPYMESYVGERLNTGYFTTFLKYWTLIKAAPTLIGFRPSIQDPWIVDFIAHLRKDYEYEKIGLIGYCWGGGNVARLSTMPGVADTAIPVHPGGSFKWAISKAAVPVAYLIPEVDHNWDPKLAADVEEEWKNKEDAPKHLFKTYPGTVHGFGARPNLSIPRVKESWEELMNDIVEWYKETL